MTPKHPIMNTYNFVSTSDKQTPLDSSHFRLIIRQQPKQARLCNSKERGNRRPIDPPPIIQLKVDEYGGFFVFGDISIRVEGRYRLRFSLFEVIKPSAEKLLSHSFFRQAKKKEYLYSKLLQSLPPLEDRPHKRVQQKPISYTKGVTWDFAIDSEYRNEDTLIETEDMKVKQDKKAVKFTMQSEESEIDNSTNTLPKKSRFSVEGQPQSEEIIKGRFSIIESNSSKEKSTPINLPTESDSNGQKISSVQEQSNESLSVIPSTNTPNESLLQLPSSLSRDSSLQSDSSSIEEISQVKNNRFQSGSSINTESPTIKNTEKIVGTKK
ncbi:12765_t:CDS:2, partial [Entrophospora sp. SA101]